MINQKKATSIVEVLVIIVIVLVGTIGMYQLFSKGMDLSNTTSNRIKAIGIAREGIEAVLNIRDTNNIMFSSNYKNCWNTYNYNVSCVSALSDDTTTDIPVGSYKIFKNIDNKWYLIPKDSTLTGSLYSDKSYRDVYKVGVDSNGLYTQSGGIDTKPTFTREIKIDYIPFGTGAGSNSPKMNIKSLVQWSDSSKQGSLKVELSTMIFNTKTD